MPLRPGPTSSRHYDFRLDRPHSRALPTSSSISGQRLLATPGGFGAAPVEQFLGLASNRTTIGVTRFRRILRLAEGVSQLIVVCAAAVDLLAQGCRVDPSGNFR